MTDTAAEVITHALSCHRTGHYPARAGTCACGLEGMTMGDRRESHLADVAVAALTQAGLLAPLGQPPATARHDVTRDVHWRVAALAVVATWDHEPIPGVHVAAVQQEDLAARWPSMANAITRLVHAKAALLEEKP